MHPVPRYRLTVEATHDAREGIKPFVPLGRGGSAADVAAAVLFFCRPGSSFTTGQTLLVAGGYGAGLPENSF